MPDLAWVIFFGILFTTDMRPILKNVLLFFVAFLLVSAALASWGQSSDRAKPVGTNVVVEQVQSGKVKSLEVSGDRVLITLTDGSTETIMKEPGVSIVEELKNFGVTPEQLRALTIEVKGESGWAFVFSAVIPFLLPFVLLAFFIYFMSRQIQGANPRALSFGQSGARESPKDGKHRVTFDDVAGAKEAKEELMEVVEFLRSPKKFTSLGAKIPKGVLLLGPPGVGKTLLSRAVAGEANVPFFHISGSEFVEMFVGVGASRVRDLFQRAKKHAPCIVFVDELDAVGRQRGTGLGGGHDEREQTLNQILVEMDGFDPSVGIVMLAATNRPDVLDPALLRPGRFDRRVMLDNPDVNDREAILKIHARNKPLVPDANLRRVAERTPGFSGADLANLLNEAAIMTARRNLKRIGTTELFESIEKVLLGPERRSHLLNDEERKITAYHEGGHALVAHSLPHSDTVHKVSIVSRGRAAGYTLKLPSEDRHLKTRSSFIDELAVLLGGYCAEEKFFGEVTTGASNDLKEATRLARRLITNYGMSAVLGPRTFGEHEDLIFLGREMSEQRDYSEKIAEVIDAEITTLIADAKKTALDILERRRPDLERIVAKLMEHETIEQEEFRALVGDRMPTPPSIPMGSKPPRTGARRVRHTTPTPPSAPETPIGLVPTPA